MLMVSRFHNAIPVRRTYHRPQNLIGISTDSGCSSLPLRRFIALGSTPSQWRASVFRRVQLRSNAR